MTPNSLPDTAAPRVRIPFSIAAQPDERSCGPTALHAVYRHLGLELPLESVVDGISQTPAGGTLAVQLGNDALARGFAVTLHTCNLQVFDPTWFSEDPPGRPTTDLAERLRLQQRAKSESSRLRTATGYYLEFLERGGQVCFPEFGPQLVWDLLDAGHPLLTGLSVTYLYRGVRERPDDDRPDDVRGHPVGHFVVVTGYDRDADTLTVADPWPSPDRTDGLYTLASFRVLAAILLGVLTYDANLLVIERR